LKASYIQPAKEQQFVNYEDGYITFCNPLLLGGLVLWLFCKHFFLSVVHSSAQGSRCCLSWIINSKVFLEVLSPGKLGVLMHAGVIQILFLIGHLYLLDWRLKKIELCLPTFINYSTLNNEHDWRTYVFSLVFLFGLFSITLYLRDDNFFMLTRVLKLFSTFVVHMLLAWQTYWSFVCNLDWALEKDQM